MHLLRHPGDATLTPSSRNNAETSNGELSTNEDCMTAAFAQTK